MLTRYAIFDGNVRPGQEAAMRQHVNDVLTPLWRRFTGALEVRVMFGVVQDANGPNIPLILAISYADETAMQAALESPARYESRDLLPAFYDQYFSDVTLYHYVMQTQQFQN